VEVKKKGKRVEGSHFQKGIKGSTGKNTSHVHAEGKGFKKRQQLLKDTRPNKKGNLHDCTVWKETFKSRDWNNIGRARHQRGTCGKEKATANFLILGKTNIKES